MRYTPAVPTYEYRCAEGHITEVFQKMTDAPLRKCGTCGKKVERVLFPPSIHYKGTGFYSTDYGKGGKKPKADGKSEGGAKDSGAKKDAPAAPKTSSSGSSGSSGASGS